MGRRGVAVDLARSLSLDDETLSTAGAILDEELARAREALTGVELPLCIFVEALVVKHGAAALSEDLGSLLSALRVTELYLAIACVRGDKRAFEHFEARYGSTIGAACRRFARQIDFDEAQQRVRQRLLFSERPGIASYSGVGDLAGWVRVSAVRALINVLERENRDEPAPTALLESIASDHRGADSVLGSEQSRDAFKRAFVEAFETLSNREKSLLRYAYADGVGADRIGAVYRVHRATASRWVSAARDKLVERVVEELVDRLDVSTTDVPSVLRAALSQVPTTVVRHLREG